MAKEEVKQQKRNRVGAGHGKMYQSGKNKEYYKRQFLVTEKNKRRKAAKEAKKHERALQRKLRMEA